MERNSNREILGFDWEVVTTQNSTKPSSSKKFRRDNKILRPSSSQRSFNKSNSNALKKVKSSQTLAMGGHSISIGQLNSQEIDEKEEDNQTNYFNEEKEVNETKTKDESRSKSVKGNRGGSTSPGMPQTKIVRVSSKGSSPRRKNNIVSQSTLITKKQSHQSIGQPGHKLPIIN